MFWPKVKVFSISELQNNKKHSKDKPKTNSKVFVSVSTMRSELKILLQYSRWVSAREEWDRRAQALRWAHSTALKAQLLTHRKHRHWARISLEVVPTHASDAISPSALTLSSEQFSITTGLLPRNRVQESQCSDCCVLRAHTLVSMATIGDVPFSVGSRLADLDWQTVRYIILYF